MISFPAHFAFNMAWVLCASARGRWAGLAACLLSVGAMGLHQFHVHLTATLPFLGAMLMGWIPGGRGRAVLLGLAQGAALLLWMAWPQVSTFLETGDAAALEDAALDGGVGMEARVAVQMVRLQVQQHRDVEARRGRQLKLVGGKLQDIDHARMLTRQA